MAEPSAPGGAVGILGRILARKRAEVVERRQTTDLEALAQACKAGPRRDFRAALERARVGQRAVIAEIKRASPSAGVIRADFDPAVHAASYARAGATCLSVLTDQEFFGGSEADLVAGRRSCSLPVLRKDFTIDPWQIDEAVAIGADAVLLIVAALDDDELRDLHGHATRQGLTALVEVHDDAELQRALALDDALIGVNNRNLTTFTVDLGTVIALRQQVPAERLLVAESGIRTPADVARLRAGGIDAFLVGEALMREPDPGEALQRLFE